MKLLVLGGTVFLGRHIVKAALVNGHEVTLFNRGQHNSGLFPEVEKLRGNRDGGLDVLARRRWDAAIDTSGYVPRLVKASAEVLAAAVEHYTFISSLSVYGKFRQVGITEETPLPDERMPDETTEEITGATYGPLKVLCEQAVEQTLPGRSLIVRPGLIVGPHDPTDRFTYWPWRVAQGGEVLAPAFAGRPVQFSDARDLAQWTVRMVEARQTGVFNTNGPDYRLEMGQVLDECKRVSGSNATFSWVDGKFLVEAGVTPWMKLPLWINEENEPASAGFFLFDCSKAINAGLSFRPIADTVRDTLAWDATRPADLTRRAGLTREREAELLAAWYAK